MRKIRSRDTSCPRWRGTDEGYTLLELLIVLAILGLLMALAAPRFIGYFAEAKSKAAAIQISTLEGALDLYRLDVGSYPTAAQGLRALLAAPTGVRNWAGPYLDRQDGIDDPWGRPFVYRLGSSGTPPVILSLGADGKPGGSGEDADVTSAH